MRFVTDHACVSYLPLLCLRDVGVVPRDDADDPDREGPLGGVSGGPGGPGGGGEERCGFFGGLSGGIDCSTDSPGRGGSGSTAAAGVDDATASGLYILARSFR